MKTVETLEQAYTHFLPYDRWRPSQTVTIYDGKEISFMHWDQYACKFTIEDGPERDVFDGWDIEKRWAEMQSPADNVVPFRKELLS